MLGKTLSGNALSDKVLSDKASWFKSFILALHTRSFAALDEVGRLGIPRRLWCITPRPCGLPQRLRSKPH
jgi:hypothetical protein